MAISGCGNPDSPTGPAWTSAAPVSTPADGSSLQDDDPSLGGAVSDGGVTTTVVNTVPTAPITTTAAATTFSPTATTQRPLGATAPDQPAAEEYPLDETTEAVAGVTTTQDTEERLFTYPDGVMANDYWADLGFPDPAAPPVEDLERIRFAEAQIQKIYFKWYDAVYRRDPETLWEAVVTEGAYERGVAAMDRLTFTAPPTLQGVKVKVLELYIDHPDCLVAAYEMDISSFRDVDGFMERTTVMWPHPRYGWRRNISFRWPTIYGMWWANCFMKERPEFP